MGEAWGKEAKNGEEVAKEEMEVGRLGNVGEAALPVSPPQLCLQLLASLAVLADVFPLFPCRSQDSRCTFSSFLTRKIKIFIIPTIQKIFITT